MKLKITTLIENKPCDYKELFYEHGLSMYIQIDGKNILFDTGQTGNFIANANKINVDLNTLDYVLLSHGHYDHTGGVKELVENTKPIYKMFIGEKLLEPKYKYLEEDKKFIGNLFDKEYLLKHNIDIKFVNEDIINLTENVMVFTNFENTNEFEKLNKKFFVIKDGNKVIDDFSDEICLAVKLEKGLFVIVGCSHVGIINILETIKIRTGMPIYGVIGGTHLVDADEYRLDKTIEYFKDNDIGMIRVSHCTGEIAVDRLKEEFEGRYEYNNTGNVIELDWFND